MPSVVSVTPTGDVYIDGVLSGVKWGTTNLTFSFPTTASFYGTSYGSGETLNGFEAFTAVQQAAVRTILNNFSAVTNLNFTEVTESATTHADIRYAESDLPSTAWAYYPSTSQLGGDAWFNNSKNWYDNPVMGNYAWLTMLHETGHAMGLKHPHQASGVFNALPLDHDSLEYTVMSYRSYIGAGTGGYTNGGFNYPQTLMMYDIAALQTMYGADYTTNSGNTVYSWSALTGQMFVNGVGQTTPGGNKVFMTLWDGGGRDTYDFSNYATNLSVDLRPGGWTTVSSVQLASLGNGHVAAGNIANALLFNNNTASLIEDVIGGVGNDVIIGNVVANRFTGGAGNDSLDGDAGVDTAAYSGLRSYYTIVYNADGSWTVTDLRSSGDGVDTLRNIEYLAFNDVTLALADQPTAPTITPPTISSYSNDTGIAGDGVTSDQTITIAGVAVANSLVKVYDGTTLLGSVTASASGVWSFTTTALADGAHSFSATASDTAGNTSANSSALSLTIDTAPPAPPAITAFSHDSGQAGDALTNDNTLQLSGVADAGSTVRIYDHGVLLGTIVANANGEWTFTSSDVDSSSANIIDAGFGDHHHDGEGEDDEDHDQGPGDASDLWSFSTGTLTDGTHQFTAVAVDAAGNMSAPSAELEVTIDTQSPNTPVISAVANVAGATSDNSVQLSGIAEASSTVAIYDGGALIGTTVANASGAWTFVTAPLSDGGHAFTATAKDAAGNVSASSPSLAVTIDTQAPPAPSITSFSNDSGVAGDGITNDNTLTLNGIASAHSTVRIYDGATLLGVAVATAVGAWSFTTLALEDGAHSLMATATDLAGNTSPASSALNVHIDTVAPDAPTIASFADDTGSLGDGVTADDTLTLNGIAAANSVVNILSGATLVGSVSADAQGQWQFTTESLVDGTYGFSAVAVDAAGNASATSSTLTVTVTSKGADSVIKVSGPDGLSIFGSSANDYLVGGTGNDVLLGALGDDVLNGRHGADQLDGGEGNDMLIGGDGDDTLLGGAGNDYLRGGVGADIMRGGSGNDYYLVEDITDQVIELADDGSDAGGVDTVRSTVSFSLGDYIENLSLIGTDATNGIGNSLNNIISGNAGVNVLDGGSGNDVLKGGDGDDTLLGAIGDDYLDGGAGADLLDGGEGNDTLKGGDGNDTLLGGAGNDYLRGGLGADVMRGGSGNDYYLVEDTTDQVSELADDGSDAGGVDMVRSTVSFSLGDYIENLSLIGTDATNGIGNALNNIISGNVAANVLDGGEGNDVLKGGDGDDTLLGGAGADYLNGGNQNDWLDGGEGNDTLKAGDGDDTLLGGIGDDYLDGGVGADHLDGGDGNDRLKAGDGNDMLVGGAGNDYLDGGNGADLLDGGAGNDRLFGGEGDDVLLGGLGDDYLNAGAGNDHLTGGDGFDFFVFSAAFGHDTVTDYQAGMDRFQVSKTMFANFTDFLSNAADDGQGGVVVTADADNSIVFENVSKAFLQQQQNDFHFV